MSYFCIASYVYQASVNQKQVFLITLRDRTSKIKRDADGEELLSYFIIFYCRWVLSIIPTAYLFHYWGLLIFPSLQTPEEITR